MHTTPADTVHNAHKRVAGSKERKKMKFLDLLFSLSTKWRLYFIFVMMSLFLLGLQNESSKEASGSVFFASSHRTLDGPDWPGCIWWGPASGRSRTVMFDWQVLHPDFWSGAAVLSTTEAALVDGFLGFPLWSVVHRTRRLPVDPLKPEPETSQPLGLKDARSNPCINWEEMFLCKPEMHSCSLKCQSDQQRLEVLRFL